VTRVKMKKHVLFIVENNAAPHDARVWPEALVAKKNGFDVTVISPANALVCGHHDIIDGIEIYRHPQPPKASGKIAFILEYVSATCWEFLLSLRIYKRKPFQIIHCANPPDHLFVLALFYKLFGVKYIFDHHDLAPELYLAKFSKNKDVMYRLLNLLEKISCKLADAVVSSNSSYKKIVIKRHLIHPHKVFVVRNDPKPENFTLQEKIQTDDAGKINLLFLGSIGPQDGIDNLLKALHYLVHKLEKRNFICRVVGGGESLAMAKDLAKALQLEPFMDFKGLILGRDKVLKYLHTADICLEPAPDNAVNRHSTFIKIMEYMASGKPIVAFNLPETRYSTNNSAILIEPGNIKNFALGIKKLMDDPNLRDMLGRKGKERIIGTLNWTNAASNLKQAYESLAL
jgi:glycosyltransferase involved in cell wall biosynthesis